MTLRTGVAALAVLGALAGCGGEADPEGAARPATTSTEVRTTTEESDVPVSSVDAFMTPSTNIACRYSGDVPVLRCDIRSGLNPPPSEACELDWTGIVIGPTGAAEPQCAGDTVFENDMTVLGYGETWRRDGLECLSSQAGLECSNEEGSELFLSRESWRAG